MNIFLGSLKISIILHVLLQSKKYRPGTKALREIRKYQKGTDLLVQVM